MKPHVLQSGKPKEQILATQLKATYIVAFSNKVANATKNTTTHFREIGKGIR